MNIDKSQLITGAMRAERDAIAARDVSISRLAFCNAIADLGVVTNDEAIAAARGGWPASMNDFLGYLNEAQARDAQIEWATCTTVDRMHPFVLVLGSWLGLPDDKIDAMFGVQI